MTRGPSICRRSKRSSSGPVPFWRARPSRTVERHPFLYDPDRSDAGALAQWRTYSRSDDRATAGLGGCHRRSRVGRTPSRSRRRLGWVKLLVAALLRRRAKTRHFLLCMNRGLREIPVERRRAAQGIKLDDWLEAMTCAADIGLKDHDRWLLARQQFEQKAAPSALDLAAAPT